MTQISTYNYSEKEISMLVADSGNEFLWLGFNQDASGNCAFQKVSFNNPLQVYYDIDLAVTEIKAGKCDGSYIYLALNDTSLIAKRYTRSSPLSTPTDFSIPSGITEAPIDILIDTYVYLLIPGLITHTKIVKMTLTGSYVQAIDLTTVANASSFCKSGDDFWVVTNTSPAKYIRVYPITGGNYNYTVHT